jgi:hypothetical protein
MQAHGCKYACHMCHASKPPRGSFGDWEEAELRTLGSIRKCATGYENAGSVPATAQQFYSCVHQPLSDDEDDVPTMFIVTPSELHLGRSSPNSY